MFRGFLSCRPENVATASDFGIVKVHYELRRLRVSIAVWQLTPTLLMPVPAEGRDRGAAYL